MVRESPRSVHHPPVSGQRRCHRVGADQTAFAYRNATFSTVIVCAWQDPALDAERIQWVRGLYDGPAYSEAGGYVNFMSDDDQAKVQDSYGANFARLARIEGASDPGNLFHLNQNIPPSG